MGHFDVICLGELLIDFTPHGVSKTGMRLFEQNPGGAPGNVAVALCRLGYSTAFIGKVGDDINGRFLKKTLQNTGVNTDLLLTDPDAYTTMAFVALSETGERDFSFVRDADTKLRADELKREFITQAKVLHFGSLSMTHEPARAATLQALKWARAAGCIISYDPNYRAVLWSDESTAVRQMCTVLGDIDLLKVSDEEVFLLTGMNDIEDGGRELLSRGPSCVTVTQGSHGATVFLKSGSVHTPTFPGPVADTTGAGDAFMGGFISRILDSGIHPKELSLEKAEAISRFAHAVATRCVAKRGGIPAMPSLEEAEELLV